MGAGAKAENIRKVTSVLFNLVYLQITKPTCFAVQLHLHKPITKRATKPRMLSEESSEMDHGKQRSELRQSTSAAQHSPVAYISPIERPTSTCGNHA